MLERSTISVTGQLAIESGIVEMISADNQMPSTKVYYLKLNFSLWRKQFFNESKANFTYANIEYFKVWYLNVWNANT